MGTGKGNKKYEIKKSEKRELNVIGKKHKKKDLKGVKEEKPK